MLNKALSALTSYILWGFVFSFAYMNRLLKARLFFDYSPREKNYEVETQRLWGPLKWCTATSPNRKFIIGKKKPQTWSPNLDETLSYRQIALPVSMWLQSLASLCFADAMAQLVEALRYKPEGRGFYSLWYHLIFSLI